MPDFDEAVAADEAERGDADEEDPVPEETEEELQVDDQETATSYLDRLESTIDSLEEPEA